jgi:CheY-like chemotaxis protein
MSATVIPPNPVPAQAKKKRVLLVDTSRTKRDLRSETMRKLGAEVDCAADIIEARSWWRADLYDLVLMHIQTDSGPRDKFCDDIRRLMPNQKIMFLVGKPEYLATAPNADEEFLPADDEVDSVTSAYVKIPLGGNGSEQTRQRWGILEACRRISAARSALDARTRAIRDRPTPPRDPEFSRSNPAEKPDRLAELIREELQ